MVKAPIRLDVPCKRRIEGLSFRCDPVNDGTFQTFGVIGTGIRDALLNLDRRRVKERQAIQQTRNVYVAMV
jgi:hypothetical protein